MKFAAEAAITQAVEGVLVFRTRYLGNSSKHVALVKGKILPRGQVMMRLCPGRDQPSETLVSSCRTEEAGVMATAALFETF
jgi:hypothetical protein